MKKKTQSSIIYYKIFILLLILIIFIIIKNTKNKFNNNGINSKIFYLNNNSQDSNNFLVNNILKQSIKLFLFKEDDTDIKNKSQIHISMALDNNLVYPTLVSMTSALENNNKNQNILIYYLLLSHDFNKSNIEIFESLKMNYHVKINYYIIPPIFNKLRRWTSSTECIYYKLLLPFLLPTLKKIIFLDGDSLVYKNLREMYDLDFNNNYILGYPFHNPEMLDKWGIKVKNYINVGCILINLEKIVNEKKDIDLINFSVKYNKDLFFPEQDSINILFYPNVGFLPLKYGIYLLGNIYVFRKKIKKTLRFEINETELIEAINDPSIVHFSCCSPKVWFNLSKNAFGCDSICKRFQKDFYFYANKTKYYSQILNLYMK